MIEARVTRSRGGATSLILLAGSRYAMIEAEGDEVHAMLADRSTDAEAENFALDFPKCPSGQLADSMRRICEFLQPISDTDPAPPPSEEPST